MNYSIKQLANLCGISVRALHYYDEIGLLRPIRNNNDYREYDDNDLTKLQQILFFRRLDFSLEKIKEIILSPDFDSMRALHDQKELLNLEKIRLDNLQTNLDLLIANMQYKTMNKSAVDFSLSDDEINSYTKEAKERWGNTEAYKQSQARMKNMSKEEFKKLGDEGINITKEIAAAREYGFDSNEVQTLIEKHFNHINRFYDCSFGIYKALGQMYVDDSRFTAYYEKHADGLAQFMHQAIDYFCDNKNKSHI
jgi:DNA-binding transcriptional MerR regulator